MNKCLSVFYHVSSLRRWNRLYINTKVYYSAYCFPHIFFRINIQLESNTSPWELSLYKLHIFNVIIISWNLSFFKEIASTRSETNVHDLLDSCNGMAWLRWLDRGSSHSSHHPAKFIDLVTCESEDKIFLVFHVTTQFKCHVTLWVGLPHPK